MKTNHFYAVLISLLMALPNIASASSLIFHDVPADVTVLCGNVPDPAAVTAHSTCCNDLLFAGSLLYYSFDNTQGNIVPDQSGNSHDGIASGAQSTSNGYHSSAMSFDGVNDKIVASHAGLHFNGKSNLTIAAWINVHSFQNTPSWDANPIVVQWQWNNAPWIFTVTKNHKLGLGWNSGPNAEGQTTLLSNQWYHVAVTYNGSHIKFYINGVLDGTTTNSFVFTGSTDVEIGGSSYDHEYTDGKIDDLVIYDRTLSSEEIETVYSAEFAECGVSVNFTENQVGDCPAVITRSWSATDSCDNASSVTQTITVADSANLSLSVPADVEIECGGDTGVDANGTATGDSLCGNVVISSSDSEVTGCGNTKTITRTWTATDGCSNTTNADQIITLVDTTAPSLSVPANATVACDGDTSVDANGTATGSDGCGNVVISYIDSNFAGCTADESVTRVWTATDDCGNTSIATQTITVADIPPPLPTSLELIGVPADAVVACGYVSAPAHVTASSSCCTNPTSEGRLRYYSFDQNQENAIPDQSGNGNDGVADGALVTPNGHLDNAMVFDGINDEIVASHAGLYADGKTKLTIAAWVNVREFQNTPSWNANPIAVQWQWDNAPWIFTVTKNHKLGLGWNSGPNAEGQTTLLSNQWYHVAVTYDGSTATFYLNGNPDGTFSGSFAFSGGAEVEIGGSSYDNEYMDGRLDEVFIYDRALNAGEVHALFLNELDDCGVNVSLQEDTVGECPAVITRTWTATDTCGNSTSATQTITVEGTESIKLIGVPADTVVKCGNVPEPAEITASSSCCTNSASEGRLLYYSFDYNQANAVPDQSGNGHDGIANGALLTTNGYISSAMELDGINDEIVAAHAGLYANGTSNITIAAWINICDFQNTQSWNANPIAVQWQWDNAPWIFTVTRDRTLGLGWNSGPNAEGQTTLQSNQWYHVAVTYDGSTVTFYLNGDVDGTYSGSFAFTGSAKVEIGGSAYDREFTEGFIDEVNIYDRALDAAEIHALFVNEPVDCNIDIVLQEDQVGECPAVITRTWTATDSCGNSVNAEQIITVVDSNPEIPDTNDVVNLVVVRPPRANGNVLLSWPSEPGRQYRVERASSVSDPYIVLINKLPDAYPVNKWVDTAPLPGQAFYRVLRE